MHVEVFSSHLNFTCLLLPTILHIIIILHPRSKFNLIFYLLLILKLKIPNSIYLLTSIFIGILSFVCLPYWSSSLPSYFMLSNSASTPSSGTERSSTAWSNNAALYASSLSQIPSSISIAAAQLLSLSIPIGDNLPISFVDVAAGPGTLTMEVIDNMQKLHIGGKLLITDFAPGMIDGAKQRIRILTEEGKLSSNIQIDYAIMDGQALEIPDASVTHVGCMFGIMFYADVMKGIKELRRILVPGGRAVIGTWRDAGAARITNDFAAYLGLPHGEAGTSSTNELVAKLNRMAEIGKDPVTLTNDLLTAGFTSVEIHAVPTTFRSSDWAPFLAMMRSNPAMSQFFIAAPADTDWDTQWKNFLTTGSGKKYVPNGTELEVTWLANVAVAIA